MVPLHERHPVSGHLGPVILGHEVVGIVAATGEGVDDLSVGQRVVPGCGWWCGACPACRAGRINICQDYFVYGISANGGLAEWFNVPAKLCVPVPQACSTEAAAMAQPCAVALHALRRGEIREGQTIALFGVGGVGSLLLASLRAQQAAVSVLAVDVAAQRLAVARALHATAALDGETCDPVGAILEMTGGRGVDVAIEATGVPQTAARALSAVRRGGTLLQVGIPPDLTSLPLAQAVLQEKNLVTTNGQVTPVDLPRALSLLTETDLAARVGCRVIPLDDVVEGGLRPLAEHVAPAKVLVRIAGNSSTL
jgi:(R,R)-butanediol dehydrogenase/meso-butanediol dehydrogenase/diacetyl reductase